MEVRAVLSRAALNWGARRPFRLRTRSDICRKEALALPWVPSVPPTAATGTRRSARSGRGPGGSLCVSPRVDEVSALYRDSLLTPSQ